MTPHYSDDWLNLYGGDCREVLASLPSDSVDCVVTSPPYWGLRDYGTATWEGGDAECDHKRPVQPRNERPKGAFHGGTDEGDYKREPQYKDTCGKCGATRIDSQLGLECTPDEYVANMVDVFREVRRVLKPSGTCWLNLGDSYAGGGTMGRNDQGRRVSDGEMRDHWKSTPNMGTRSRVESLKPKDLVGIPWRVAFALQADGWYLRSDIIWSKPNPMPESVTDRPTKSHEYLFLLTKSARYYFDSDAVREPHKWQDPAELAVNAQARQQKRLVEREAWRDQSEYTAAMAGDRAKGRNTTDHKSERAYRMSESGRNIRSVWTIATRPYPGAHFAVFPPELPERCIKAGSSEKGVCPECGAPWERVVQRESDDRTPYRTVGAGPKANELGKMNPLRKVLREDGTGGDLATARRTTTGWRPPCAHTADPIPATTLDPFGGSGTVGMVANRLSRRAILIDLNPDYLQQQMKRNAQTPLGLGT